MRTSAVAVQLLSIVFVILLAGSVMGIEPLSTAESLKRFELADDSLVVELVASEPGLFDPVDMVFDEDGRLYVVEMRDFQLSQDGEDGANLGCVRMLEDRDGDGFYERSVIFAKGLLLPTGLTRAFGGIVVATAPDIVYLRDVDGDGRADVRKLLFTGFGQMHSEALLNSLQWHLDNWIHGSGSHSNGRVKPVGAVNSARVGVNDFRIRFRVPLVVKDVKALAATDLAVEGTTGGGQYGMAMDDWGERFSSYNSRHATHMIMPARYLRRNRYLAAGRVWYDPSDHGTACLLHRISPPEEWREIRRAQRLKSKTGDSRPGQYLTSGSGAVIYGGDALPKRYYGNSFVGGAANNVVHRDVMVRRGPTFVAKRGAGEEKKEFLASPDNFFRPVQLANGPDGALYVVDMYREIIETPLSVPPDIRAFMNWHAGNDRGRIWRVRSKTAKRPAIRALSQASAADLVALLGHANRWLRLTGQRLLVERQDRSVVDSLRKMVMEGQTEFGRLHALCTLEGLGALDDAVLVRCVTDSHWGLRVHGLRCAEGRLASGSAPAELVDAVLGLANDEDGRVRFQVAFALGYVKDPRAVVALAAVAKRDATDHWMRTALLSSTAANAGSLWRTLHAEGRPAFNEKAKGMIAFADGLLTVAAARGEVAEVAGVLEVIGRAGEAKDVWWRVGSLKALSEGIKRGGTGGKLSSASKPTAVPGLVLRLVADEHAAVRDAARGLATRLTWKPTDALAELIERELDVAYDEDEKRSTKERISAIGFVACGAADQVIEPLGELLSAYEPVEIQQAVAEALARTRRVEAAAIMLAGERWMQYTPKVRDKVISLVFSRAAYLPAMLEALEEGVVPAWAIEPARREGLLKHKDKEVAERAKKVFAASTDEARKKIYDQYLAELQKLEWKGDGVRGKAVYRENCASCHVLEGEGSAVGPDLKTVQSRDGTQLLMDVIVPSASITVGFEQYLIETAEGETLSGVIASESATSIVLRQEEGVEHQILRANLDQPPRASKLSMMPEDAEQNIDAQQMADLIEYVKNAK